MVDRARLGDAEAESQVAGGGLDLEPEWMGLGVEGALPSGERTGDVSAAVTGSQFDPMFDVGAPFSPGSLWWQEALKVDPVPMTFDEQFTYGPNTYAGRMAEFESSGPYFGEEPLWDFQQPGREWPLSPEEADAIGATIPMNMAERIDVFESSGPYSGERPAWDFPSTFTVDAPPYDPISTDPGMMPSELGQKRELQFTDTYVPTAADMDAIGASLPMSMAEAIEISASQSPYSQPRVEVETEEDDPFDYWIDTGDFSASIEPTMADLIEIFEAESSPAVTTAELREEVTPEAQAAGYTDYYDDALAVSDYWEDVNENFYIEPVVEDYAGTGASEAAYWGDYGEGARGTRTDDRLTLVGESGPELALFPNGTEIIPLDRKMKPSQARRLRRRGVRGMQDGGFVFGAEEATARGGAGGFRSLPGYQGDDQRYITEDTLSRLSSGALSQDPNDPTNIFDPYAPSPQPTPLPSGGSTIFGGMGPEVTDLPIGAQTRPAGITEMLTGRPTRQPRSLMRPAGMRVPSAQTIGNLLPEEIEMYQEMGRLAGIPEKAFEREFRSMVPMGQGGTRQARFTPRRTGRTRYGSI